MRLEKKYDFEVKEKFKYAYKGNEQEVEFITLHPPTSKNLKESSDLKQFVFRALTEASERNPGKDKDEEEPAEGAQAELTGADILLSIYAASRVSLAKFLVTGIELLSTKGVAEVDGEERLTKTLIDKMDPDEFEEMLGEYIARFIMASALAKANKK
jgi:hypothetical protein